jgi:hypothetical protein
MKTPLTLRLVFAAAILALAGTPALAQGFGGPATINQPTTPNNCVKIVSGNVIADAGAACGTSSATGANPTATIGAAAVNGVATTFMRSDGAPALPATLPALSGVNLTDLNATNLASGTVASARVSGSYTGITGTGTLTAGATGAGFTVALGTSTITGTLPAANGGAGSITGALRGDGAGVVTQAACADLSNDGTACTANTGTSGNAVPFLDGTNTWSATQSFASVTASGGYAVTGALASGAGLGLHAANSACLYSSGVCRIYVNATTSINSTMQLDLSGQNLTRAGTIVFGLGSDAGISRTAASTIAFGNGTAANSAANVLANSYAHASAYNGFGFGAYKSGSTKTGYCAANSNTGTADVNCGFFGVGTTGLTVLGGNNTVPGINFEYSPGSVGFHMTSAGKLILDVAPTAASAGSKAICYNSGELTLSTTNACPA